jgi:hypothetical protein
VLNTEQNTASARAAGDGLYALMTSIKLPLQAGWNQIAYPVQATRPVTEALASIQGVYTTVKTYDPTDPNGPWLTYDVNQPEELNTLRELRFGRGYFIHVSRDVTLRLKGPFWRGSHGSFQQPAGCRDARPATSNLLRPSAARRGLCTARRDDGTSAG